MTPNQIVEQMFCKDGFSQWLGISVDQVSEGTAELSMMVREDMLNGFGVAHGGITYSLADSALAFASNAQGKHAVSIETSISHTKAVMAGDRLTAVAKEDNLSSRLGIYSIEVTNQNQQVVALFKGTVFRKDNNWTTTQK
mgnify:CR=1 FL=1